MFYSKNWLTSLLLKYIRSFKDHPGKLRIVNYVLHKFYRHGMILSNSAGTRLLLNVNDWMDRNIILFGQYEPLSIQLAGSILVEGGNFLDVGANVGLYSCSLGNIKGVQVFSVEPGIDAVQRLRKNISLNGGISAYIFHLGLAAENNIFIFETEWLENLGTARVVESTIFDKTVSWRYAICCVTLTQLLNHINAPIKLMKMDVEGFEFEILKGMEPAHPFKPENIIMEFKEHANAQNFDKQEFISFVSNLGYKAYTIRGEAIQDYSSVTEHNIWLKIN